MGLNFNQVRPVAQGQWLSILAQVTPILSEAIKRKPKHVACPVHGGKDGFKLYENADETGGGICNTCGAFSDGFALICWCNGWKLPDALKAVANFLGIDESTHQAINPIIKRSPAIADHVKDAKAIHRKREALNAVKTDLVHLDEPIAKPAREYLINRGLGDVIQHLPGNMFFHPALSYWEDGKDYGKHPALVALIRDVNGLPITYHRTYLSQSGQKADLPTVKKLMSPAIGGTTKGGAIHLYQPNEELILAEGIETALALYLSLNKPCWACVSAGGLETVQIPEHIKRVIIGADNDASGVGQKAASTLANRLINETKYRQVKIITPEQVGYDWLDVFNVKDKVT